MSLLAEETNSGSTDQAKPPVDNTENDKKAEAELAAWAVPAVNDMVSDSAPYKSVLENFTLSPWVKVKDGWGSRALAKADDRGHAQHPCQN